MTIKEYLSEKLKAFNVSEAQLLDISLQSDVSLDGDAGDCSAEELGKVTLTALEEILLAPRVSNISENGFSISFHFEDATKYYLFLCRKYGVTPKEALLAGTSAIVDKTSIW